MGQMMIDVLESVLPLGPGYDIPSDIVSRTTVALQEGVQRFVGQPAGVESGVADPCDALLLAHAHQPGALRQCHAAVALDAAETDSNHKSISDSSTATRSAAHLRTTTDQQLLETAPHEYASLSVLLANPESGTDRMNSNPSRVQDEPRLRR